MQSYSINFLQKQLEMLSNQDAKHFIFYETVLIFKDILCTFTIVECYLVQGSLVLCERRAFLLCLEKNYNNLPGLNL